ncbi:OmpA family protein [Emticicia aquatica]|nr:OmpA family protein [Emticicia aquatica]
MTRFFTILYLYVAATNFVVMDSTFFVSKKNTTETFIEIPLSLSARDKRSDIQLRPKFTVISVTGGNVIPLKEVEGRFTVYVKSGESYKIVAELEGYHTKEKIQVIAPDQDKEGFNVVLDMEPQPSASLILKAIDDATGDYVDATFTISVGDKVFTGQTSRQVPYYRLVITKAAVYNVDVTSNTHKQKKESFALEVGEPARSYNKEIRLEKPENGVKILIVGEDTGKALKGVNLNIFNVTDNTQFFDNLLPEGEAVVEFNPAKKYLATISSEGYSPLKLDLKATNQKEYVIKLPSETYVSLGAFDRLSGKRLPANFKITYKDNPPKEIKGTLDGDIRYKPIDKGLYQIEVSYPNYAIKRESLNLENLSAGKVFFKINLESTVDEYVILINDAEDKQMIPNADVKIFDENKEQIPVKLNPKTGEYKIVLEKSKDYFLQVEANEYVKQSGTLQRSTSKLIGINMQKVFQTVFYSAIDGITKKPIEAKYKLIRPEQEPLIGVSDGNKQYKIDLYPQKPYILEIEADGYKTVSENLLFSTAKSDKEVTKTIELQKDAYSITFKVIDAQKKQAINNAKIAILNLSTSQPVITTSDKIGFTASLVPGNNYSVTAEAEGYEKSAQNINARDLAASNQFEQEIPLFRNAIEKYKLLVQDEDKGSNVLGANVRVFNSANEPIAITANPLASEWLAELKNEESYNVEIKAEGYLAYRGALPKSSNKTIKLKIKKVPTEEVVFMPIDALTKKSVVAEFKLTTGGEIITGSMASGGTRMKASIIQDKSYELEVTANGYKTFKDIVNLSKVTNGEVAVLMKKEMYSFNFKPLDAKNRVPIPNITLKLSDTENQSIPTKFSIETQEFQANLLADKKYSIEVNAPGYEQYGESVDVNSLATSSDFKRDIFMTKKEVEKKTEPKKEEPIIVEKKPEPQKKIEAKVTEPEKLIEKKTEPVVTAPSTKKIEKKEPERKYEDNAVVITDEDFKVKVEVFENLGIGKRFRLSNLYFEQSSSQIKPQSFPQLDKLVNTMKLNPKMKIEIVGHTDNNGDPRLNLALSHFRATVISNYLFNKGVAASRIKAIGKGQDEPIAPNDNDENRIKNRRVEFVITDN